MNLRSLVLSATALLLAVAPASAQSLQADEKVTVREARRGLLAQATVRPEAALRTALARVPGGRLKEAEIEIERRRLVYSFELAVPAAKGIREVLVDAKTGAVLAVEDDDEDTDTDEDTDDDTDDTDEKARRPAGSAKSSGSASPRRP